MQSSPTTTAPKHLSDEAAAQWCDIVSTFDLAGEPHCLLLLRSALESFDMVNICRKLIAKEGATTKDRWGQTKAHPAATIERDARAAMSRDLSKLGLQLSPPGN